MIMPGAPAASALSVVALAGRRIDAEPTKQVRFPFHRVETVRRQLAAVLAEAKARALVCSGACGADLVGADVAQGMGLRTRVVLPFPVDVFRTRSVVDRPRAAFWGGIYDAVIARARANDDLVELELPDNDSSYTAANGVILEEARRLADAFAHEPVQTGVLAIVVWEGAPRGPSDATADFLRRARAAQMPVREVLTIELNGRPSP